MTTTKEHKRLSGVFLHPTSLPDKTGIGSLGNSARSFVDWLQSAGQHIWQMMPLGPTGYGNSPYATLSAFAGNPMLIDLESLVAAGLLEKNDLDSLDFSEDSSKVNFEKVVEQKPKLLKKAWDSFKTNTPAGLGAAFHQFCDQHHEWLQSFAHFAALKEVHDNKAWYEWDEEFRQPNAKALEKLESEHGDKVGAAKFIQWLFFSQWHILKAYAAERDVQIMGDLPIFVAHDSADVWANQELFHLNPDGSAAFVAGVPPDYFSETGQLWGNPLYRWDRMKARGYHWWMRRIAMMKECVDLVRIDHFRGFEAYWEIPGDSETAIGGRWVKGPDHDFFHTVKQHFGSLPFVAEDLGVITPEVEALRDDFQLPGMRVLQFAFTDDWSHPFLPHNYVPNSVVYLGTHDNDTTVGWLQSIGFGEEKAEANPEKSKLCEYLELTGQESAIEVNQRLLRLALSSVSETCILMMQDLLGLDGRARINTPSEPEGNWEWRMTEDQLSAKLASDTHALTERYHRLKQKKSSDASA